MSLGKSLTFSQSTEYWPFPRLGGTDLSVEDLGSVGGHGNETCTSVDGSGTVVELELFVTKSKLVKSNLPVALALDGAQWILPV